MSEITKGYYCFLCSIGVPYWGTVKGHGKACSLPIPSYSTQPISGNIGGGKTYVSHDYVSTVIPDKSVSDTELEKVMKDFLIERGIYDPKSPNEPIKIKDPNYLQVKVNGDSTSVVYNLPPYNLTSRNKTSDILGAMEYAKSKEGGYQKKSIDLTKVNNREYQSANYDYLNAARKTRSVSSFALTINDWIAPSVEAMKKYPSTTGKSMVWFQKDFALNIRIDSRNFPKWTKPLSSFATKSQYLKMAPTALRSIGYALGPIGLGITVMDISVNGLNRNNGTHFVMGVVALIPQTRVISMAYFMTNMLVSWRTGKNIEDYYIGYEEGVKKAMENHSVSGHWNTGGSYSPYQAY